MSTLTFREKVKLALETLERCTDALEHTRAQIMLGELDQELQRSDSAPDDFVRRYWGAANAIALVLIAPLGNDVDSRFEQLEASLSEDDRALISAKLSAALGYKKAGKPIWACSSLWQAYCILLRREKELAAAKREQLRQHARLLAVASQQRKALNADRDERRRQQKQAKQARYTNA